jgi:hypothetical protein
LGTEIKDEYFFAVDVHCSNCELLILNYVSVNHRVVLLPDNRQQFRMLTILNYGNNN